MTIPRDRSALGLGLEFPISNNETAPLLPSDQETTRYGSGVSNEPGTKCRVRTTRMDVSQSEEERTSSKSMQELSSSLSALHPFTKSPVNRTWRNLTGGWCDEVSLRLQNSGSVARDHLALERTFLAYMRTSLAIASAGIALVQLFSTSTKADAEKLERYARPLGASVIAMGLIVLSIGLARYFTVQSALVKGVFPVARLSAIFLAVALTTLVTVVFSILVTGRLQS